MSFAQPNPPALGPAQALMMIVSPQAVFRRIAESGRYGWTLGALVLLLALIGWATVQTGLIDGQVNQRTFNALADLEREQTDLLSRAELSDAMEKIRQAAEFNRLVARGGAMVAAPAVLVASIMLIAALLFAVVALVGNKPEYPTLIAICVYSAIVDLVAAGLRLAMMLCYRTMNVDTSLGLLLPTSETPGALEAALAALDPFRAWFWILVALGLATTGQLSRRAAVTTCVVFWLVTSGARMVPALAGGAAAWAPPP